MAERILIVDDEETRKVIISMLSSDYDRRESGAGPAKALGISVDKLEAMRAPVDCGYREASDGLEAMSVLGSGEKFDLVLADLVLPSLDGMRLLKYIRVFIPTSKWSSLRRYMRLGSLCRPCAMARATTCSSLSNATNWW